MLKGKDSDVQDIASDLEDRTLDFIAHNPYTEKAGKITATRMPEVTEDWPVNFPDMVDWYIGGEDAQQVEEYLSDELAEDVTPLINNLGEHLEETEEVENVRDEYSELLDELDEEGHEYEISVKPTQLGLEIDRENYEENVWEIAEEMDERGKFLWIDMESTDTKEDTIDVYRDLNQEFDNVGLCVQAYLSDTSEDLEQLQQEGGVVRLVKGAYDDDAEFSEEEIDRNYEQLMEQLFEGDSYFALATHDESLVQRAQDLQEEHDVSKGDFEFQVLKGVMDEERQQELIDQGYQVKEYVPYGDEGIDYFWRRIQEHPKNLKHGLRNLYEENQHLIPSRSENWEGLPPIY